MEGDSTAPGQAKNFNNSEPRQNRVYKSLEVWSLLPDLEESLGTF